MNLRRLNLVLAAGVAICSVSAAMATPLGLTLQPAPDITSALVTTSYNATTDVFAVSGTATSLETPPPEPPPDYAISGGSLAISLQLQNGNGNLISGTLSIGGTIASIGATPSPLLTGTATAWGYVDPPGGNVFEFLFTVNGGKLSQLGCGAGAASPCYPLGSTVAVVVSTFGTAFPATFTSNYSNSNFSNVADAAPPVPEPSTVVLAGVAAVQLLIRRRAGRSRA